MKMSIAVTGALCAAAVTTAALAAKPTTRNRAEIPAEFRWDFSAIYPSWAAWEEGMKEMEARIGAFAALKGTLAQGPAQLLKAYQAYDDIGKLQYRLYRYPGLQRDVDTRDQAVAGRFQRVGAIFAKFDTASAWFTPELLGLPEATVTAWIAQTPALAPYRFPILDNYRRKAHVLDDKGERLLSLAGQFNGTPPTVYQELSTSDIKFPTLRLEDGSDVVLSPGNYGALLQTNRNQADRGKAAAAHVGTYGATANTYASIYNSTLQRDWFVAQARNFDSTLDAALDGNAIPKAVVETLIEATRAGSAPFQRYARLRQKLLGLPSYHLYDAAVPIYRSDTAYPYEQARELATASVAPLGADYVARYKQFVFGGRVDVYENEGKRSGAYSAGVYGVGPYMLMNYNDTLDAAFTLAHEAGHSMHTVLSYETQPFATADYTIFVAEVASTTNERFLLDQLLKQTSDPKERFLLLQHAVDSIVGTFYTQVLFADFELRAHRLVEKGQPLTTEVLSTLYAGLLKDYWGDAVSADDFYKYTWARIPHFFNSPYYVYQYATCFASSAQLYDAMTTGASGSRQAATDRYLTLLKSGGNDHPMAQLKKAGVDLTQRATFQAVIEQMDRLVSQMEAEAAKIR
ncbi:MAG TPA: oligoendopeptidase F [Caldimonas sp.]|jgi:oligoendopeptidase F|nr:oligoendopeptidase F [Caldimonas sp.]HEV7575204.1 oligoendopeptidase F [Caldimonas sp.]